MNEDVKLSIIKEAHEELMTRIKQLPINMTVNDVMHFLDISQTTAYILVNNPDFPTLNLCGIRKRIIPKVKFLQWYMNNPDYINDFSPKDE